MCYKNKILVSITGGLGNQLFQYSIGRMLSILKDVPLWLDISFFKEDNSYKRKYLLDQFNIHADVVIDKTIFEYNSVIVRNLKKYYKVYESYKGPHKIFVDEPYYLSNEKESFNNYLSGGPYNRFYHDINKNRKKTIILDGYWQSEKYFINIENIIREDLSIVLPIQQSKQKIAQEMQRCNSVCLGIRQYSDSPESSGHYKLTKDYYEKAIDIIARKVDNPRFYVFTLEDSWAKDNITCRYPMSVIEPSLGNENAYEDLFLMSQCKHFIIANSTYHWWGAWLARNKDKNVVAPGKGWGNEEAIPDSWIKII